MTTPTALDSRGAGLDYAPSDIDLNRSRLRFHADVACVFRGFETPRLLVSPPSPTNASPGFRGC